MQSMAPTLRFQHQGTTEYCDAGSVMSAPWSALCRTISITVVCSEAHRGYQPEAGAGVVYSDNVECLG